MRKFKEKNINSFFYFFYTMILTALYLGLYNFFSLRKEINPGFGNAISISNNNDICMVSKKNIECQKNLFKNLDNNKTNILFLGNSQTGSINHYQEGDESFITSLNKKSNLSKISIQAKGIWLPNANLREFEIIYKSLKNCFIDPEILFLPVFLDDLRRDSIRQELDSYEYYLCKDLINTKSDENLQTRDIKLTGNIEKLNNKIKSKTNIFNKLKSLNGKVRVDLYKLRNLIFNIKPSSIRRVKRAAYQENIKSLENIIHDREIGNFKTFIYIPPLLNSDNKGPIPYDKNEYLIFKDQVKNICKNEKCIYLNLEKSVPNEFWGLKTSTTFNNKKLERDFMHFTNKGHNILSEKLLDILISHIK